MARLHQLYGEISRGANVYNALYLFCTNWVVRWSATNKSFISSCFLDFKPRVPASETKSSLPKTNISYSHNSQPSHQSWITTFPSNCAWLSRHRWYDGCSMFIMSITKFGQPHTCKRFSNEVRNTNFSGENDAIWFHKHRILSFPNISLFFV